MFACFLGSRYARGSLASSTLTALALGLLTAGECPLPIVDVAVADEAATSSPLGMLTAAKRICVLGDSITYDGRWVSALSAWMEAKGLTGEVIAVGLPSETCSGLSEQGHAGGQFPRPDVHERLSRVLSVVKPDLVIACYGMNCGIYLPLDDTRFAAYKAGMQRLHDEVEKAGAKIIHLTPPVYDGRPGTSHPAGETDYEGVLQEYSTWLLSKRADGWTVIDTHTPMKSLLDAKREDDPNYTFIPDAVHPDEAGQWAICRGVLAALGDEKTAAEERPEWFANFLPECHERMTILRDAYLAAAGHLRPGITSGLPIGEAEAKARRITDSLRSRHDYLLGRKFPSSEWKSAIQWPRPRVVDPGPAPENPAPIPADAVVLFDGKSLDAWHGGEKWAIENGIATVRGATITTKENFGDCQLHVEFRTPKPASGAGQGRGNSGVYLMGKYEIQILDSFEDGTEGPLTYPDGQCGSLYKQQPPAVNACRAPGEWQTYDIFFTRPRFAADGSLEKPGRVSVLHNGVAIHADTVILGTTSWADPPRYEQHAEALPLSLQDHGNPLQFRSVWVRPFEKVSPTPNDDPKPVQ